jgi:iron complex outermembrane receptor protein
VQENWKRPLGQTKKFRSKLLSEQISLQGLSFVTGKIKHQIFTGIDLEKFFFYNLIALL